MELTVDGIPHNVGLAAGGITVDGLIFDVQVEGEGSSFTVTVDGRIRQVEMIEAAGSRLTVRVDGSEHVVIIEGQRAGRRATVPATAAKPDSMLGAVVAPMAGRILRVIAAAGDRIEAGDLLFILEAMKMENEIRAGSPGLATEVLVTVGQRVTNGQILLALE